MQSLTCTSKANVAYLMTVSIKSAETILRTELLVNINYYNNSHLRNICIVFSTLHVCCIILCYTISCSYLLRWESLDALQSCQQDTLISSYKLSQLFIVVILNYLPHRVLTYVVYAIVFFMDLHCFYYLYPIAVKFD